MKKVYIGDKELTTIAVGETTSESTGNNDEMLKDMIEGSITSIDIPDGTTNIRFGAFGYCTSLTSVTIPDSVSTIDDDAFYNCTALTSITIPTSVTSIGNTAFFSCTALTSITIPTSVTYIGWYAFQSCTSLISITYNGTKSQWSSISKSDANFDNYSNITVHCTDGDYKMTDNKGTLS